MPAPAPFHVIPVSRHAKTGTPSARVEARGAAVTLRTDLRDLALGVPVFRCAETGMTLRGEAA